MALTAGIPLFFDHSFTLLALNHVHNEAGALNFRLIQGTGPFIDGKNGLADLLLVFEFLQLGLDYTQMYKMKLFNLNSYLLQSFGIRFLSSHVLE